LLPNSSPHEKLSNSIQQRNTAIMQSSMVSPVLEGRHNTLFDVQQNDSAAVGSLIYHPNNKMYAANTIKNHQRSICGPMVLQSNGGSNRLISTDDDWFAQSIPHMAQNIYDDDLQQMMVTSSTLFNNSFDQQQELLFSSRQQSRNNNNYCNRSMMVNSSMNILAPGRHHANPVMVAAVQRINDEMMFEKRVNNVVNGIKFIKANIENNNY
jgi:hypothetical protein